MARNYFYNLLLTLANILFPILSFPYVSRVLGPAGIGKAQFVFSFAQYFAVIAGFGIPIYGMKEIARYREDKQGRSLVFSELMVIYAITSVCLSALYVIIIYTFPYFSENRNLYQAALLIVLLGCSYVEWVYTGMEQFKSIALRSVMFKIIGLFLMYFFIKDTRDYNFYLYLMIFTVLGNNILSVFLLRDKVWFTFSGLKLRQHLTPLFYIFGATIAASMYADADTVLLGFLSNSKVVGLYTAAIKLSKISIPIITSMAVILMPKIAKDFAENNMTEVQSALNQSFRFIAFFGIPVALGLALLAPEFIKLFSGAAFIEATPSMRVLSLLPLTIGFAHFLLFMILVPAGKNREMFLSVLVGLFTSLSLNIILIPHLQQLGSSVANICSELMVMLSYFYFVKKYFAFTYQWQLLAKAFVSALMFIPLIALVKELSLPLVVMLAVSVSGCAIVYIVMQLLIFKNNFIADIISVIKLKLNTSK